jgi:hypothetical protein
MDRHSSKALTEYELGLAEFAKTIHRNESNKLTCPNHPQALLIDDHRTGDVICTECGLVVGEKFEVAITHPTREPHSKNTNLHPSVLVVLLNGKTITCLLLSIKLQRLPIVFI